MKNKSGVTLIELVLIIAGLAILSFSLAAFVTEAMEAWVYIKGSETAMSHGRTSIERIIRELRRINRPQNIILAATSECQFIDISSATVDFRQSGSDLLRDNQVLASGLVSPEGLAFYYYDANQNPTSVPQGIRYIKVKLQLIRGNQGIILEDSARIRNL